MQRLDTLLRGLDTIAGLPPSAFGQSDHMVRQVRQAGLVARCRYGYEDNFSSGQSRGFSIRDLFEP
jgi:hypothetical protein